MLPGHGMKYMEKKIEKKFRKEATRLGCRVIKFIDPDRKGGPDRLVLIPNGLAMFIEFKQPGEVPRRDQIKHMMDLNRLGFPAFWAVDAEVALTVIKEHLASKDPHGMARVGCDNQIKALRTLLR